MNQRLLLISRVEDQKFAVDLSIVERVIHAVQITNLSDVPPTVLGIVNIEGKIVPIFDTRERFNLPAKEVELSDQIVLARTKSRVVGLLVDNVEGVADYDDSMVVPASQIMPGIVAIEGALKLKGEIVLIHDLEGFLSAEETRALDAQLLAAGE